MGKEPLDVNPEDEEIYFIKYRIPKIEALTNCVNLKVYNLYNP